MEAAPPRVKVGRRQPWQGDSWRPQRDSNPRYRRERPVSWAGLDDGDGPSRRQSGAEPIVRHRPSQANSAAAGAAETTFAFAAVFAAPVEAGQDAFEAAGG